jgi:hypothetical protein
MRGSKPPSQPSTTRPRTPISVLRSPPRSEHLAFVKQFPETGFRMPRTKDIHVRRVLIDRFEYAIVFALLEDEIVIVAVHHQHRRPGYWKPRLASARR